ncbi:hypothetical protein EJD97_007456, partial [Solanum chilense]
NIRRLKKYISQTLSMIIEKKEKEKNANEEKEEKEKEKDAKKEKEKKAKEEKERKKANEEKEKEKAKKKGKKVEIVSCDVKSQYPFEGFNIDGEGRPTKLMSSFSQWINEGLYKHHAKK